MTEQESVFLTKARESLNGADSEFVNGRYNNCANRAYYACFQAAIAALQRAGIEPRGEQWGHDFVQARFNGVLINQRHLYPTELRGTLERTYAVRRKGDYTDDVVSRTDAERALRRTRTFTGTMVGEMNHDEDQR